MLIFPILITLLTLIGLELKHFLCDFVYQTKYMLRKNTAKDWYLPLAAHAGVHAGATAAVVAIPAVLLDNYWLIPLLAIGDGVLHCVIDGIKARCFQCNVFHHRYWVILGLDQLLHSLTYIIIATLLGALAT